MRDPLPTPVSVEAPLPLGQRVAALEVASLHAQKRDEDIQQTLAALQKQMQFWPHKALLLILSGLSLGVVGGGEFDVALLRQLLSSLGLGA